MYWSSNEAEYEARDNHFGNRPLPGGLTTNGWLSAETNFSDLGGLMLIYGTRLWFEPQVGLTVPVAVVSRWLSKKVGKQLSAERFLEGVDRAFDGAHQVRSVASIGEFPKIVGISYSHPDQDVGGRQWVTEIGLRQMSTNEAVECTILLRINDISARVEARPRVSRPGLVTELVRRCSLSPQSHGVSIHELDDEGADAFRHVIFDPRRTHSIIVLSPDSSGHYIADPKALSSMVLGLADIITIAPGSDTFWLARVVGRDYIPYRGAARLIYPLTRRLEGGVAPTRLVTPADADLLSTKGVTALEELFSLVLHRSNLPLSWAHIGLQAARDLQLKRELAQRREHAAEGGNLKEHIAFLDTYVAQLELDKIDQAGTIETLERLVAAQDDRERQQAFEVEALKQHLAEAGRAGRREVTEPEDRGFAAEAIRDAIDRSPEPEEVLRIIEHLFPDRIVILPDAWRAARDARSFKHGRKLYELLHILATDYWGALDAGGSDAEARKVLGSSYAAQESETVAKRDGARKRRTFEYGGEQVEMMKHLKIGVKDSTAETIRVHFEWFPGERRIVIGHCGAHLLFK